VEQCEPMAFRMALSFERGKKEKPQRKMREDVKE
jgi:hypothetical protein